jgi:hypothetical protein
MELLWALKTDMVTSFGVYYSSENECLFTHGECEIARVKLTGAIEWSVNGKDIFTGGFSVFSDHIEATDFNGETYCIGLSNGNIHKASI